MGDATKALQEAKESARLEALADARRAVDDLLWDRQRLGGNTDDFQEALDAIGEL